MRYRACPLTTLQRKIKKPHSQPSLGVFPFALQPAFIVEQFLVYRCNSLCLLLFLAKHLKGISVCEEGLVIFFWTPKFWSNYVLIKLIIFFFFSPQSACGVLSPIYAVYVYCALLLPYSKVTIAWQSWDLRHLKGKLKSGALRSCLNKVVTLIISCVCCGLDRMVKPDLCILFTSIRKQFKWKLTGCYYPLDKAFIHKQFN